MIKGKKFFILFLFVVSLFLSSLELFLPILLILSLFSGTFDSPISAIFISIITFLIGVIQFFLTGLFFSILYAPHVEKDTSSRLYRISSFFGTNEAINFLKKHPKIPHHINGLDKHRKITLSVIFVLIILFHAAFIGCFVWILPPPPKEADVPEMELSVGLINITGETYYIINITNCSREVYESDVQYSMCNQMKYSIEFGSIEKIHGNFSREIYYDDIRHRGIRFFDNDNDGRLGVGDHFLVKNYWANEDVNLEYGLYDQMSLYYVENDSHYFIVNVNLRGT